jgi:hypothetical protein
MAEMLVGQFDDFDSAHAAVAELRSLGIVPGDMEIFALNAPGQHDQHALGGDEDVDRGAHGGGGGALSGAALGGVAGLALGAAAIPVVGPLAAAAGLAVGAYTGSLAGAVNEMGDDATPVADIPPRPAGVRLVVHALTPVYREHILAAFRRHAVRSIEEAVGTWRDGTWADFDPVSVPRWIEAPADNMQRAD